jgi:hypothetical protein
MHASNVIETCDSTNASTSQDDSELSSHASPPSTPPRGRTRYPDTLTRVPLHRRGTSNTYERLEDLLREAGYKETRVFTPESERHTEHATDKHTSNARGGVGAVVGFLAGLVSRNSSLAREPTSNNDSHSQPPSPLAHFKAIHASSSTSSYSFNTSPESLRKHSRFHATQGQARRNQFPETHGWSKPPSAYMRHQSSSNFSKDAPNAHAYLRHMASAPNIQPLAKRPSSSNVSLRSHRTPHVQPRSSRRAVLLTADDIIETDDPPPLPRNWMESVAKALLSGVPEAASTRKTSSALSEATNRPKEQRRPPLLCAQVREQRAGTTEGKVSQTNVMCRSTPTSRAGSRVRRTGAEDDESRHRRDEERWRKNKREEESRKGKGKGKRKESDMVPSLARTRVENDEWNMSRYLASHRQEGPCSSSSSSEDEDEEDEGELDLERLLVPARRQASIRSLRKHLHPPSSTGSLRGPPRTTPTISNTTNAINSQLSSFAPGSRQHIWLDDSWGTGRGRRWVVGEDDDDEGDGYGNGSTNGALSASEIGGASSASTRTHAGMKRRRGLPSAWAQWGG